MAWSEIDLGAALWTLPRARAKNDRQHVVPLAPQAVAILKSLPRYARSAGEADFVFSHRNDGAERLFAAPSAEIDAALVQEGAALPLVTFHDLRRTVASGMARWASSFQSLRSA